MADTLDLLTLIEGYRAINDPASVTALGSEGGTGGHDTELAQWITALSRAVVDRCGAVVNVTYTDETYDGGRHTVWLKHRPISSVTTVKEYDDTTLTTLTVETNASKPDDAYLADGPGKHDVLLRRRSANGDATFASGRRNVVVTYVAGRAADTAAVDEKFKTAAGSILRRLWNREGSAWSTGGAPFEQPDRAGFFRAVAPMIDEFLWDEKIPPGVA